MPRVNEFGQPIGASLSNWIPPDYLNATELSGSTVTLVPMEPALHAEPLFAVFRDSPDSLWTYMPFGPFRESGKLEETLKSITRLPDWQPYTLVVNNQPLGFLSYLRINPPDGVIELGSIVFSPALQRTTPATEAMYLLIKNAFDSGYRRCEWKSDDLNAPSRTAGERLGFRYEGTFLQATHYKGRNRDTAWYAITDEEWPVLDRGFRRWLSPANFDDQGRQIQSLTELQGKR